MRGAGLSADGNGLTVEDGSCSSPDGLGHELGSIGSPEVWLEGSCADENADAGFGT
jgi:hypothetical protein